MQRGIRQLKMPLSEVPLSLVPRIEASANGEVPPRETPTPRGTIFSVLSSLVFTPHIQRGITRIDFGSAVSEPRIEGNWTQFSQRSILNADGSFSVASPNASSLDWCLQARRELIVYLASSSSQTLPSPLSCLVQEGDGIVCLGGTRRAYTAAPRRCRSSRRQTR
jgi:hypothetical protein